MRNRFLKGPLLLFFLLFFLTLKVSGCGGGPGENEGPPAGPSGPSADVPLEVRSTFPAGKATGVAVDSVIKVTFFEEMDRATLTESTFFVRTGNRRMPGTVRSEGKTALFTPSGRFASQTAYVVTVTTGVKTQAGKSFQENFSWEFTTAAAPDRTQPTVSKPVPSKGALDVAINSVISATFSEAMDPATVNPDTVVLKAAGQKILYAVQLNGATVTLKPASELKRDTNYTVTITTGVKDLAGNAPVSDFSWTFRTGGNQDISRPLVRTTRPADRETEVSVDETIVIVFNEPMDLSSIHSGNITITADGKPVSGRFAYSGTTTMFIPLEDLQHDAVHRAIVTTGVRDEAGNPLMGEWSWTFRTEARQSNTPPAVLSTRPSDGKTGIALKEPISATFNHAMDDKTLNARTFMVKELGSSASVPGTIAYDHNTKTVYFIPQAAFSPSKIYQAILTGGIQDASGNFLASDKLWTFSTERREAFLFIGPSTLTFMATQGGPHPAGQRLTITDRADGNVRWSLSSSVPWLTLHPSSGTGSATVTATVTTTELSPKTHEGNVSITASGAEVSPGSIPVQYSLTGSGACPGRTRRPYIAFVTPRSATLAWECAPQGTVEWGVAPSLTFRQDETPDHENKYFVTLPELTPDTAYSYRVTTGGETLGAGTFRTAKGPDDNHFSFIIFGDSGAGTRAQKEMAAAMEKLTFSFAIITGDVIYETGEDGEFDAHYFDPYKNLINYLPFFPVAGNHDLWADFEKPPGEIGTVFKQNFFHPTGKLYYDFYWGETHFIALNSTFPYLDGQVAWLEQTLAASAGRWKVVYFHHPPYNSGYPGDNVHIQKAFVPIMEKYGVDLVFAGHAHSYERIGPIGGIPYIITGGGGAGLTQFDDIKKCPVKCGLFHHLLLAEMTADTLTIKVIGPDGKGLLGPDAEPFDTFSISKAAPVE